MSRERWPLLPSANRVALLLLLSSATASLGARATASTDATDARAQRSRRRTTVLLDVTACLSVSQAELRRLVGIELGPLLVESSPVSPSSSFQPDADQLTLICDADRATLRARAAGQPQTVERALSLADFPGDAAARGLTLAGIELLASLDSNVRQRIEGGGRVTSKDAKAPVTSVTSLSSPAGDPAPSVSIAVVALRRAFLGTAGLAAWGGRLDLVRDSGRLRLTGDLEVDATAAASTLGDARAFLSSAAGFVGVRFAPAQNLTLSLSAGARLGVARLEGSPAAQTGAVGDTVWRPWWGPALSARGTIGGSRLAGLASIEVGFTARGAEALAAGTTVLSVRGLWLTAAAGAQF